MDGVQKQQSLIEVNNLTRVYQMGTEEVRALWQVTTTIKENEYVAIMGPSGSGKSTFMNILGCLDTPSSGLYRLNKQNVAEMDDDELAGIRNKEIGFVFQTFNLLSRSNCIQNVALPLIYAGMGREERRRRAVESLDQVGLAGRLNHHPNELSGGQRQRVAVARALVNRPSLILADEPTGNLDSETSKEIMLLFERLYRKGNTLLVVTHEDNVANHARRILHLRDGEIERDERVETPVLADIEPENKA